MWTDADVDEIVESGDDLGEFVAEYRAELRDAYGDVPFESAFHHHLNALEDP